METDTKFLRRGGDTKSQRGTEESPFVKWLLITVALAFVVVFLLLPLVNVFWQSLAHGLAVYWESLVDADTRSAIKLTLLIAGISVPLNLLFGVAAAWAIAKFNFKGKPMLISLIDLPFAISPVVAGLMFVVLFGRQGFFGEWFDLHDIKIIFAVPGMVQSRLEWRMVCRTGMALPSLQLNISRMNCYQVFTTILISSRPIASCAASRC